MVLAADGCSTFLNEFRSGLIDERCAKLRMECNLQAGSLEKNVRPLFRLFEKKVISFPIDATFLLDHIWDIFYQQKEIGVRNCTTGARVITGKTIIKDLIASVNFVTKIIGIPNPVESGPEFKLLADKAYRELQVGTVKAQPLSPQEICMIESFIIDPSRLKGERVFMGMFLTAIFTCSRMDDIQNIPCPGLFGIFSSGSTGLKDKTNQDGGVKIFRLDRNAFLMHDWIGIFSSLIPRNNRDHFMPALSGCKSRFVNGPLPAESWNPLLRGCLRKLNIEEQRINSIPGHSARSTLATAIADATGNILDVQRAGDWRSLDSALGYIRKSSVQAKRVSSSAIEFIKESLNREKEKNPEL